MSYDDVRIYEISTLLSARATTGLFSGIYTEIGISWGTIDKGDSTDKDWQNFDDRSQLTNFSYSDVKGDDVMDYTSTRKEPARAVTVELLSASGEMLGSTKTDESGSYTFEVDSETSVRVQAKAEDAIFQAGDSRQNLRSSTSRHH